MGRLRSAATVGCVLIAVSLTVTAASGALATAAKPAGTAAASLSAGGPVPARSSATSITFVSTQTAYVLGTAPCAHRPCTVILRTRNRGASWVSLSAPAERVSRPNANGLWGLRFANPRRGFAYGNGLWETTNGAATWRRATPPAHFVADLAITSAGEVVALAAPCQFSQRGVPVPADPLSPQRKRGQLANGRCHQRLGIRREHRCASATRYGCWQERNSGSRLTAGAASHRTANPARRRRNHSQR